MKIKLLKKLRRRFVIQKRNSEYRLVEKGSIFVGDSILSIWTKYLILLEELRREYLLEYAQDWKIPKK